MFSKTTHFGVEAIATLRLNSQFYCFPLSMLCYFDVFDGIVSPVVN